MSNENMQVIEINGVKLEVDLRLARRVDTLRVGSRVKVLKKTYGERFDVYHGVIVGFDEFKGLPTINAAYIDGSGDLQFMAFNSKSENDQIIAAADQDQLAIEKDSVVHRMDRAIAKAEEALEEAKRKKAYFLSSFGAYWEHAEAALKAMDADASR